MCVKNTTVQLHVASAEPGACAVDVQREGSTIHDQRLDFNRTSGTTDENLHVTGVYIQFMDIKRFARTIYDDS
jgi:hypothetical protein